MSNSGDQGKIITGDEWKRRPEDEAAKQPSESAGDTDNTLHVDDDWKAQARADKERLAKQAEESGEGEGQAGPGGREMPPANFQTLMSTIASQALLYMGAFPDPATGQRIAHLELASHHIDLLGVIEEKTKGNLDEEESKMLTQTLHELRMYHVQLSEQLAKQQAQQPQGGDPQNPFGGGGMGGGNPFGGGPGGPLG